jgi:3-methyladenine DNA glycosylase AlkC
MTVPRIPSAPKSIQKGVALKDLLGQQAIDCLIHNISLVYSDFDGDSFFQEALKELEPLSLINRGQRLANVLRQFLPENYESAIDILLASLTPPLSTTEDNGLEVFFYLPHVSFVAEYGLDPTGNNGQDPFEVSMNAQYQLTKRFSAEFSMRQFLIEQQDRTLARLMEWTSDNDPHVRRLCSEGARPKLPWAKRIPSFIANPEPLLPILETLKNDPSLYVRRSVANHLGDIAKDHPDLVFEICERWLVDSTNELKWVIRHALRHPAKKGNENALNIRKAAKARK